jgi:FRG domain.
MSGISSKEWAAFLEEINKARHEIGDCGEVVWYRGQNSVNYPLLPNLLRYRNGTEKEKDLFTSFRKFGDKTIEKTQSEWETLFHMQHYGVPTRLLDWTETFGIALFFAVHNRRTESDDAAIFLLNPLKLNTLSSQKKLYVMPRDENMFSYTRVYFDHNPFDPNAPIAVEPAFVNSRMHAQRGVFTVHDNALEPMEDRFPSVVRKVLLPQCLFSAAQEFLELANINEFSVYPDIGGLLRGA